MKKIIYMPVLLLITAFTMVSCDGLLNVDSEQYTYDEQYRLGSENDSLYAFVGLLSQVQLLGDRYVLLGELRGDLMETGDGASKFLKEINEFNVTKENPYSKTSEYYGIINNCNYVIKYVDTSAIANAIPYNVKVMAMAKAVRAWTYLQLVLNYKEANYISTPILDKEDALINYPIVDLSALCDSLIEDLYPFYQKELPRIGSYNIGLFADFDSKLGQFNIRFLLGDLYLWKASLLEVSNPASAKLNYAKAANMYFNLMNRENLSIARQNATSWTFLSERPSEISSFNENWQKVYDMSGTENITALASSADYGKQFTLDSLAFNRKIIPTKNSIANWDNQLYLDDRTVLTDGDLRKRGSVATEYRNSENVSFHFDEPIITKFLRTSNTKQKVIVLYRNSLLYLRYAEAVNRLRCSNLSFATLKNGLNETLDVNAVIQAEILDKMDGLPSYMSFSAPVFTNKTNGEYRNVGVHARGCGLFLSQTDPLVASDTTYYKIPYGVVDSAAMIYVEEKIVEELALETAFEGNRFHDLMRFALRRGDPSYLAEKVSAKYTNKAEMKIKLENTDNWYLKK